MSLWALVTNYVMLGQFCFFIQRWLVLAFVNSFIDTCRKLWGYRSLDTQYKPVPRKFLHSTRVINCSFGHALNFTLQLLADPWLHASYVFAISFWKLLYLDTRRQLTDLLDASVPSCFSFFLIKRYQDLHSATPLLSTIFSSLQFEQPQ